MSKELDEYMKAIDSHMEEVRLVEAENVRLRADLALANKALEESTRCFICDGTKQTSFCEKHDGDQPAEPCTCGVYRTCSLCNGTGKTYASISPESRAYIERMAGWGG